MILKELLDIDQGRIERSKDLSVKLEWSKMLINKRKGFISKLIGFIKGEAYITTNLLKFKVINSKSGSSYTCYVELEPKNSFDKLLKTKVKIFCSCNDFKYRAAYYLNKDNNLFKAPIIEEHLGIALTEKPRIIKPTNMCKHMYAVVDYIKSEIKNLQLAYE